MTNDLFNPADPFGLPPLENEGDLAKTANAPREMTVTELSQKLKQTVENAFSYVRVRGELSRITVAKSGHLYTDLKDADSVINAICWKGSLSRLSIKPEEGMDVVVTGRLTTYPGRSNYQIIIETMELAGEGALLRMLEERKKKLAAEGLFDPARKKEIPFLPRIIGIVTSPTGAVIRDIMHRLEERFPVRVLLYPVMVQGQGAAQQVAQAIAAFNSIPNDSLNRPDLLIVARGGGSLEDLMPFNDEAVVRAAAMSSIPLISAVGHETDTTLIDFAADLRAPTPTAAAEKAVPVRSQLIAQILDGEKRLYTGISRLVQHKRTEIQGLARGLPDPRKTFESRIQKLDHLATRLDNGLSIWLEKRRSQIREISALLSRRPLVQKIADQSRALQAQAERLTMISRKMGQDRRTRLENLATLLQSLSFERVLERGYAVVYDSGGNIVSAAKAAPEEMKIRFRDDSVAVKKK